MHSSVSLRVLAVALSILCPPWPQPAQGGVPGERIPLPEHPRPDFLRPGWTNLNGLWEFGFDKQNKGLKEEWQKKAGFPLRITVPFPWGSAMSGLSDEAPIGWYSRSIAVPESWRGQKIFLVIGACDWETQAWIDGQPLGTHRGGYLPFEFDLTPHVSAGREHKIVLRVDDATRAFKLEGKQGYGNARGIWQTVYLEARAEVHLQTLHFVPEIDSRTVRVKGSLSVPVPEGTSLELKFRTGNVPNRTESLAAGKKEFQFEVSISNPRLWTLEDPFLYEVEARVASGPSRDVVSSYFGMRKISVGNLPGTSFPYVQLNHRPVYLQMTLDQSYHPEGFYTFPTDEFMRDEILRSRRIGVNANRLHVKVDVPRKLYWADRLGLLIMADVPNSWGEPDTEMRAEIEQALRGMLHRDFNHPSIFAWVPFNETWGLFTKSGNKRTYLPETQTWVASVYQLAKQLDPTRLVEDNSPCNHDHVETDINSWHAYLPGFEWRKHLDQVSQDTFPGSGWNFIGGRKQGSQPLLNSECGNVWGYEGSSGDVDWSWDYHIMMNEFRRHPKVCGWLYTEHHDVINEWNGYYRFDRSEKATGLEEIGRGMTLADLHAPFYISTGSELCREAKPGESVSVPIYASFLSDNTPGRSLRLRATLSGWNTQGQAREFDRVDRDIPFQPWSTAELKPLSITLPKEAGLAVLNLQLEDAAGAVLHRNFTTFLTATAPAPRDEIVKASGRTLRYLRFAPSSFKSSQWSLKQWSVLDGLKVNGAGHGYFEYSIPWPKGLKPGEITGASLVFEASAKQLFGKDRSGSKQQEGDFMLGKGTHDPSLNPNSYPMTDMIPFRSAVRVRVNGRSAGQFDLPDDPADHRGVLSWHSQKRDRRLREAGSYGYLIQASMPRDVFNPEAAEKELTIRFEVDDSLAGGLAIYGERFGRYPLDPTIVLELRSN